MRKRRTAEVWAKVQGGAGKALAYRSAMHWTVFFFLLCIAYFSLLLLLLLYPLAPFSCTKFPSCMYIFATLCSALLRPSSESLRLIFPSLFQSNPTYGLCLCLCLYVVIATTSLFHERKHKNTSYIYFHSIRGIRGIYSWMACLLACLLAGWLRSRSRSKSYLPLPLPYGVWSVE